jgi:Na+/H+ antiporter NhaD/arsenite permease-like protein
MFLSKKMPTVLIAQLRAISFFEYKRPLCAAAVVALYIHICATPFFTTAGRKKETAKL